MNRYDTWLSKQPIAHRGLHNKIIPENSLQSFENAIAFKYAIELDIRISADGDVFVFHDKNLKRMTGFDKEIESTSTNIINKLKLSNTLESIPLLSTALEFINNQTPVLIELKNDANSGLIESTVNSIINNYNGNLAVQSFNKHSVSWFKQNKSKFLIGQVLSKHNNYKDIVENAINIYSSNRQNFNLPDFYAYDLRLLPCKYADRLKNEFSVPIISWTIFNKQNKVRAYKYADNIIFENLNLK